MSYEQIKYKIFGLKILIKRFLLMKIAGNSTVVLNARITKKGYIVANVKSGTICYNNIHEVLGG